ncbi:MAG: hypothetical protein NTX63_04760 [Candidatus Peregrinibacteria bacterium]|nr:hypothetical protein [Candidatus Peregrinibacteria bacterium]
MLIYPPANDRDSFGDDATTKDTDDAIAAPSVNPSTSIRPRLDPNNRSGTETIGIEDFVRLLEQTRIALAMDYMKPRIPLGRPPAPELDFSTLTRATREAIKKNGKDY